MSIEQREALDALVRGGPLDLAGELAEQRELLDQLLASIPVADDVETSEATVGGIPAVRVATPEARDDRAILYLHGGAYTLGSARGGVGLASEVARRVGAPAYSLEYRLAPEHPYPAGPEDCVTAYRGLIEDGLAPSQIALVGESAGGGLVIAALVRLAAAGLPQPACAAVMSPWVDLTLTSPTLETKASADPALTLAGLRRRGAEYLGDTDATAASPLFADLSGLAPLLIQAGSHEILLGDALSLAARVAESDGHVELQVWPGVPHVFQGFAAMLDEGTEALDSLGAFVTRHLAA
jgi:acetyl esterase/lipase